MSREEVEANSALRVQVEEAKAAGNSSSEARYPGILLFVAARVRRRECSLREHPWASCSS